MVVELVPLCTLRVHLKPGIEVGTGPAGTRIVVEVATGRLDGDRLRGELVGAAAADWLIIGPEGTGTVDVRAAIRTDDGAIIFVQYNGRLDTQSDGPGPVASHLATHSSGSRGERGQSWRGP